MQPPCIPVPLRLPRGSAAAHPTDSMDQVRELLEVAESLERDVEHGKAQLRREQEAKQQLERHVAQLQRELEDARQKEANKHPTTADVVRRTPSYSQHANRADDHAAAAALAVAQEERRRLQAAVGQPHVAPPQSSSSSKRMRPPQPPPPPPTAAVATATRAASAGPAPPVEPVRNLTLKQLLDVIHCILASKEKHELQAVATTTQAPKETVEQHMYTYLNQRFGLQPLTIEYASAITKACKRFGPADNDVATFQCLLSHQVDEGFLRIKHKLQTSILDLLRAYFQARFPLKPEPALLKLVQHRVAGDLQEDEWLNIVTYLYDPQDVRTNLGSAFLPVLTKHFSFLLLSEPSADSYFPPQVGQNDEFRHD